VEISTVSQEASRRVAEAMSSIGVGYVRSPVSGSTAMAAQGGLTTVISGPAGVIERLNGFYAASTQDIRRRAGGRSSLFETRSQFPGGRHVCVTGGSLGYGPQRGVRQRRGDRRDLWASPLLQYKRDTVVNGAYDPAFAVNQIMKDLDIIAGVSRQDDCPMPLVAHVSQQYEAAFVNGCGGLDIFVLAREAARIAGL
jgi:3-hydroxyisobutyrate dehydrogenase-like beta-hydroxyacid dehydrogenase